MANKLPWLDADGIRWLSSVLHDKGYGNAVVERIEAEALPAKGAFGSFVRLHISYEQGKAAGPSSLVVKIPRIDESNRDIAVALGVYVLERRFYAELAPRIPVRVPICYYVGDDDEDPLVLEDLGDWRTVNQTQGLNLAEVTSVIDSLAILHTRFWPGHAENVAKIGWLNQPRSKMLDAVKCNIMQVGASNLRNRYAHCLPEAAIDACEKLAPQFENVLARCAEGPLTLVHGDARADNWMFSSTGEAALIDWQSTGMARGTQDVAYVLAGSLGTENQVNDAWGLLRRYYDALCRNGVSNYSWTDCLRHYRQNALHNLYGPFSLLGDLGSTEELVNLADVVVPRNVRYAYAIDAFAAL